MGTSLYRLEYHISKKRHEDMFQSTYRMTYFAFRQLSFLLHPFLKRSVVKSRSELPVLMHSVMAIGLRYLTGAKYHDLMDIHGVSRGEVFRCVDSFLNAV